MDVQALIIWLIVGAIAGWLAGMLVKGGGYGLIGDIIVGIIGGFIAGWLLPQRHCDRGRFCCRDYQRLHRCGYSAARFAPG
jgi:uncharacterized membrane protein YeaQ/YmgE (transglycosylase-associated protein family)